METKDTILVASGVTIVGLLAYIMLHKCPTQEEKEKELASFSGAIGGASLIAGSAIFLLVVLAVVFVLLLVMGTVKVGKAVERDPDRALEIASKTGDVYSKFKGRR